MSCNKVLGSSGSKEAKTKQDTLDDWKLHLDSCATYHSAFVEWSLDNIHVVDTILKANCNTGVTTSNEKGYFGFFYVLSQYCALSAQWLELQDLYYWSTCCIVCKSATRLNMTCRIELNHR